MLSLAPALFAKNGTPIPLFNAATLTLHLFVKTFQITVSPLDDTSIESFDLEKKSYAIKLIHYCLTPSNM